MKKPKDDKGLTVLFGRKNSYVLEAKRISGSILSGEVLEENRCGLLWLLSDSMNFPGLLFPFGLFEFRS